MVSLLNLFYKEVQMRKIRFTVPVLVVLSMLMVGLLPASAGQPGTGTSFIYVQNADASENATIVATFYGTDGSEDGTVNIASLPPYVSTTVDTDEPTPALPSTWQGSVVVSSDRQVAAVGRTYFENVPDPPDHLYAGDYTALASPQHTSFLAYVFNSGGRNNIIAVQNTEDTDATVTIHYLRRADGTEIPGGATCEGSPIVDTIPANGVVYYDLLNLTRNGVASGGIGGKIPCMGANGTEQTTPGTIGEFEGAVVLSPIKGVRENVIVLDLASLYPMSMMTLNASPETKSPDGELVAPNGVRFKKSPDGLTRMILKELIESRLEKKRLRDRYPLGSDEYRKYDLQQAAIKVITNSYYGVSGYPRFRLYDRDIAAATTSVGRAIIRHTKSGIESRGYEVVYGDTDSCMVTVGGGKDLDEVIEIIRAASSPADARNELKNRFNFTVPLGNSPKIAFSYSGLKNQVRLQIEALGELSEQDIADVCASFQRVATAHLLQKLKKLTRNFSMPTAKKMVLLHSRVACNIK